MATTTCFNREELDDVVVCLKRALADPELRKLNQRAVQAFVWHHNPQVSDMMQRLRRKEEAIRHEIMEAVSELVYKFMDFCNAEKTWGRVHVGKLPRM